MSAEKLLYEIGRVGDDLVEEADHDLPRRKRWILPAACAACVALVVVGLSHWPGLDRPQNNPSLPKAELPVLEINTDMMWGGMGFEGVLARDISEYHSGTPDLSGVDFEELPVFRNPTAGEWQQSQKTEFDPAILLPEEYRDAEGSYEECQALGEYLLEEYPDWFFWMESPAVSVQHGDYNIYAEQSYQLHIFDEGHSKEDALLGSEYRDMWICLNEEEEIWIIWTAQTDLSQLVGHYPIISAQEARKLLLEGSYVSSVPYEVEGKRSIQKVELCYRNDRSEYYIPYYRFWVQVPSCEGEKALGLNTYGAYYVPAVEGKYISGMSTYDGRFN